MNILSNTTKNPEKRHYLAHGIKDIAPESYIHFLEPEEDAKAILAEADIFFTYYFERDWWSEDNNLKWLHIGGSGVNHIRFPELVDSDVVITNSRGMHHHYMSEFVLGAMLRFAQKFDIAEKYRIHRNWREVKTHMTRESFTLHGKNVGIVGAGEAGSAVGKLCKTIGMNVFGITRSVKEKPTWADAWGTSNKLPDLLKWSDFIVVAAPGIPETIGLINHDQFGIMKPSSYIINISRGNIIDERSLIEALEHGKIAGACLDVFETEPLPENSQLFNVKNLFITPHISGNFPEYAIEAIDLFLKNLKLYTDGRSLINRVDLRKGY